MSDDFFDLLLRQKWHEVTAGFHNLVDNYGIQIGVAVFCVLIYWIIRRLTKKTETRVKKEIQNG